jgi:hypothetical protein
VRRRQSTKCSDHEMLAEPCCQRAWTWAPPRTAPTGVPSQAGCARPVGGPAGDLRRPPRLVTAIGSACAARSGKRCRTHRSRKRHRVSSPDRYAARSTADRNRAPGSPAPAPSRNPAPESTTAATPPTGSSRSAGTATAADHRSCASLGPHEGGAAPDDDDVCRTRRGSPAAYSRAAGAGSRLGVTSV